MFVKIATAEIDSTSHLVALQEVGGHLSFWIMVLIVICAVTMLGCMVTLPDSLEIAGTFFLIGAISFASAFFMSSHLKSKTEPLIETANITVSEILKNKYNVELIEPAFDSRYLELEKKRSAVTSDGQNIYISMELIKDNTELRAYSTHEELTLITPTHVSKTSLNSQ